jgi:hypothetical protein
VLQRAHEQDEGILLPGHVHEHKASDKVHGLPEGHGGGTEGVRGEDKMGRGVGNGWRWEGQQTRRRGGGRAPAAMHGLLKADCECSLRPGQCECK